MADKKLLTVEQVAKAMQVSVKTVYRLVTENKIPSLRVGSSIRFDPDKIQEWQNQNTCKQPEKEIK